MKRGLLLICVVLIFSNFGGAQSLSEDLAKAKSIKLLEATRTDLTNLFGNTSPFMYGQEVFSLRSSRIEVLYSTGHCTDSEAFGVDSEDWDVGEGKAVIVEVLPRENLTLRQLELGGVRLRKGQLYRGRNDYHIYYNKTEGIAVTTYGDYVDSIMFFPSRSSNALLCRDEKIQKYYSKVEWKRDPQPKYACILRNSHANVVDVEIIDSGARLFTIKTSAIDPENDVLTYNYKVTAGKIIGVGAQVVWDLSEATPGSYSLIAGVDDGAGVVGNVVTKTVTVP
jgi:hypothetical protein